MTVNLSISGLTIEKEPAILKIEIAQEIVVSVTFNVCQPVAEITINAFKHAVEVN